MARFVKFASFLILVAVFLISCTGPPAQIGEPDFLITYLAPSFTIAFDRRVDHAAVETQAVISPAVPLDFAWDGLNLIVTFEEDLAPGQRYLFTLPFSSSENTIQQWTIDTEAMEVFFRPQRATRLEREYHLLFNYPVDPVQIEKAITIQPDFEPTFKWDRTNRRLELTPTQLTPSTAYTISLPPFAFLQDPFPTASFTWDFLSPPLEVERSQRLLSKEPLNWQYTFEFNYPLRSPFYAGELSVEPNIDYRQYWNASYTELSLFTRGLIQSDTQYAFDITLHASDHDVVDWRAISWTSFFNTPDVDVSITRIDKISRTPQIDLSFNYPMDRATVEQAVDFSPTFGYTVSWNKSSTVASLHPTQALDPSTEYEIVVDETARDLFGNLLNNAHRSQFTTNDHILDITYAWEVDEPWAVSFGYPIDSAHFEDHLYTEPDFDLDLTWNENRTKVTIEPIGALLAQERYTLRFDEPLVDAEGYPYEGLTQLDFYSPSPIRGLEDGYRPVHADQAVTVQFDRKLDTLSAREAISIEPSVDAAYVWRGNDLVLAPPAVGWSEGTTYTITLDPSVTDAQGRAVIRRPVQTRFFVSGPSLFISFGAFGPNSQMVDAEGSRALQIASLGSHIDRVQVDVHRISVDQYIHFDQVPPTPNPSGYGLRYRPEYDLERAAFLGSWELAITYPEERSKVDNVGEILLPQELGSGLYVASLVYDDLVRDQLLVNLSRTVIVAKKAPVLDSGGQITAWVSDFDDFVMPQTRISVFDRAGQVVSSGETDALGLFQADYGPEDNPYLVVARRGSEIGITQLNGEWSSRGYVPQSTQTPFFAYLYTDRPIYQPGHTVHYKGIVRQDEDVEYQLPPQDLAADLIVKDARGNEVERHSVALSPYGTFSGSIQLQEGAMLGDYRVELMLGESAFSQQFKVQDYEKPDFTIAVAADKDSYIVGENINLEIDTAYLFGEPVANAELEVRWYELLPRYFYDYYAFSQTASPRNYAWFLTSRTQILTSDAAGHAVLETLAPFGQQTENWISGGTQTLWGVEVTADDGSNQFNTGHAILTVYRQLYLPRIQLEKYWFPPSETIPITFQLSTPFDEPLEMQELSVAIDRRWYAQGWDYAEEEVYTLVTDREGLAALDLDLEENGRYRIRLRAVDRLGHVYEASRHFSIYDREHPWYTRFETDLSIEVEGDSFSVGDTAQLIVESSFDGEALLTLERGRVHEERLVELTAPITLIDVPILSNYAPNIFAFLQVWRPNEFTLADLPSYSRSSLSDGELLTASAAIQVPDQAHSLDVQIRPDQDSYAPREEAIFEIEVQDAAGQPVQAELSLALVDEAIFLLSDELAAPIHDAFFTPRHLGVYTYDSLSPERYLVLGDFGGGRGGGEDEGVPGNPRSDFLDTVLWLPSVETDAEGRATVAVTLPDTLTSWRLTAKAVSLDTEVGETTTNIVTQQAVVVSPLLPSNLIEGDSFTLSALVHNFSDQDAEFSVRAQSAALDLDTTQAQSLFLAAGESQVVVWQVVAQEAGAAEVLMSARSSVGADAVRLPISVAALALPATTGQAGLFSGRLDLSVAFDPNVHKSSTLDIEISNSISGALLSGVEYLTGFPYGCVEQVMSRALLNAVVGRAFNELGYPQRANQADLENKTLESIQRLYALQHNDGGWGWWYDDRSDDYQTAWVVFGLATIREAGYVVDKKVLDSAAVYLLRNLYDMDPGTRAFALYGMAATDAGDLPAAQLLADNPGRLDPFALATLAITLHRLGDGERAAEILAVLLPEVQQPAPDHAYWGEFSQDGYYRSKTMASQVRTTAVVLSAMLMLEPEHPLVLPTSSWLMAQRKHLGWGTTNETAFTLLALTDFVLVKQKTNSIAIFQIFAGGDQPLAAGQFAPDTMSFQYSIPLGELPSEFASVQIETAADTSLYYVITKNQSVAASDMEGAGIPITRRYLDPDTGKRIWEMEEGQLVLVQLEIEMPREGWYMLIEDSLPGGLVPINERLNSTSHEVLNAGSYYYSTSRFYWRAYGYNYKEIRDNRVSFFVTWMGQGTRVIDYYPRAATSGAFSVMPTQISAMYNPAFWGFSATSAIEILPPGR